MMGNGEAARDDVAGAPTTVSRASETDLLNSIGLWLEFLVRIA